MKRKTSFKEPVDQKPRLIERFYPTKGLIHCQVTGAHLEQYCVGVTPEVTATLDLHQDLSIVILSQGHRLLLCKNNKTKYSRLRLFPVKHELEIVLREK